MDNKVRKKDIIFMLISMIALFLVFIFYSDLQEICWQIRGFFLSLPLLLKIVVIYVFLAVIGLKVLVSRLKLAAKWEEQLEPEEEIFWLKNLKNRLN